MPMVNIDLQEVKKFSDIAEDWWNKNGDFKPLHVINPLRTKFIKERAEFENKNV
jgi:2-polyprenyl-3-methyl-5-hydroxy-6-metoxy-1,4-benzoquinol methylase